MKYLSTIFYTLLISLVVGSLAFIPKEEAPQEGKQALIDGKFILGEYVPVLVSHYGIGDKHPLNKYTANGSVFDAKASTVAHKTLPFETRIEFVNPETNEREVATVTDRGPCKGEREFDLTSGMAKRLGFFIDGVVTLQAKIIYLPPNPKPSVWPCKEEQNVKRAAQSPASTMRGLMN